MSGERLTVGVVTPHAAPGPEVELPAMTRDDIAALVHQTGSPAASHSAHAHLRASTDPAALELAAVAFSGHTLAAVAHASTTTSYVLGHWDEAALAERMRLRFGVPAVTSCAAAVAALRTYGVEHVQLVHPPWFDEELDALGARYFRDRGMEAVVTKAVDLPLDPTQVRTRRVVAWVRHHVEDRADALFLAGNGFRAADAIEKLEHLTGRPVLEANQVLLWAILTATRSPRWVDGHGGLLRTGAIANDA